MTGQTDFQLVPAFPPVGARIVKNGEEAVSMFKSFLEKPRVILMDYRMPIKNGVDASKEILQIDSSIKIIFTSADDSIKKEAISLGAFSFYSKPFTIEQIINEINLALEGNMTSIPD